MKTIGNAIYDSCCFGVDASDNLSDDRYMVFYNQPVSPGKEISLTSQGQEHCYTITLTKLPGSIVKLVFTVSIDGNQNMSEIQSHSIQVVQNGITCAELLLNGHDFHNRPLA
jgi:stress response protein SCP2